METEAIYQEICNLRRVFKSEQNVPMAVEIRRLRHLIRLTQLFTAANRDSALIL